MSLVKARVEVFAESALQENGNADESLVQTDGNGGSSNDLKQGVDGEKSVWQERSWTDNAGAKKVA